MNSPRLGESVLNLCDEDFEVPVKIMKPVIVGCTAEELTRALLKDAEDAGFDDMYNVPLTPQTIHD